MEMGEHAGRKVADDHIAQRAAAQRRDDGKKQHAEKIRSLVDGHHRAGDGKRRCTYPFADLKDKIQVGHPFILFPARTGHAAD